MNATLQPRTSIRVNACAAITLALSLGLMSACSDNEDTTETDTDTDTETPVERGQYLVDTIGVCSDCHTPRAEDGAPILEAFLSGAECFARLENGSCLNTRNLTNHETGLANRSDDEIKQMLTRGLRPSATGDVALFPVMPYYVFANLSDADLDAIVAYLRTVPAIEHDVPRSGVEFEIPAPANPLPQSAIPMPGSDYPERQAAIRGRYLAAEAGVCLECHTRHVMGSPDVLELDAVFQGGERFEIGLPVTPVSKNLTSDAQTGLGEWSVEDIVRVLKEGTDKAGDGICPPMPAGPMGNYVRLKDADALDIAHYIKSLPPAVNAVEDLCTWPPM
jgi:mono/diheme cytochrome c family protein